MTRVSPRERREVRVGHPRGARRELGRARAEHEARDLVGVTPPEELRDRAAHRVARGDHLAGSELVHERRDVVGAVGETHAPAGADAAGMAAQVGRDHMELPAQRVERAEPVEPAARHEPVEEHEGRRTGRPGDLTDERRAPPREPDAAPERHRRPDPSVLADDGQGTASPTTSRSRSEAVRCMCPPSLTRRHHPATVRAHARSMVPVSKARRRRRRQP